jgi:hypothetical protein
LSNPTPKEVERKYVVTIPMTIEAFKELSFISAPSRIQDIYFGSLRIRFDEQSTALTYKSGSGMIRNENELVIFDGPSFRDIESFIQRLPHDVSVSGKKTSYELFTDAYPLSPDDTKFSSDCIITLDDYGVHGTNLVFVLEIELDLDNFNFPIEDSLDDAKAYIEKALEEAKAILPSNTVFHDVTGNEQYANRSLIVDPSILVPYGLPSIPVNE